MFMPTPPLKKILSLTFKPFILDTSYLLHLNLNHYHLRHSCFHTNCISDIAEIDIVYFITLFCDFVN
jgi:hypothetical protein